MFSYIQIFKIIGSMIVCMQHVFIYLFFGFMIIQFTADCILTMATRPVHKPVCY